MLATRLYTRSGSCSGVARASQHRRNACRNEIVLPQLVLETGVARPPGGGGARAQGPVRPRVPTPARIWWSGGRGVLEAWAGHLAGERRGLAAEPVR